MGGANSILQSELQRELDKPLDASDVLTPRGESMKAEIIHLRNLLHQISSNQALSNNSSEIIEINHLGSGSSSIQLDVHLSESDEKKSPHPHDEESVNSECKHKDPRRILGVSEEEMKRNNAMKKLGITDGAYQEAAEIVAHSGVARGGTVTPEGKRHHSKAEEFFGYTDEQQNRTKAVRKILGTSESIIEAERAEELGRVGQNDHP
jgi:vesicle coat complex subunit